MKNNYYFKVIAGDNFKICVSPVLICTDVKKTAGGGDNISGAGLFVQL
jgi:ADP-dependent glucokinase